MADEGQSQLAVPCSHSLSWLTHALINRVSATVMPRQDSGPFLHSAAAGEEQEQLSQLPHVARGKGLEKLYLRDQDDGRTFFSVIVQFKKGLKQYLLGVFQCTFIKDQIPQTYHCTWH